MLPRRITPARTHAFRIHPLHADGAQRTCMQRGSAHHRSSSRGRARHRRRCQMVRYSHQTWRRLGLLWDLSFDPRPDPAFVRVELKTGVTFQLLARQCASTQALRIRNLFVHQYGTVPVKGFKFKGWIRARAAKQEKTKNRLSKPRHKLWQNQDERDHCVECKRGERDDHSRTSANWNGSCATSAVRAGCISLGRRRSSRRPRPATRPQPSPSSTTVSYTHLTLPTICSV